MNRKIFLITLLVCTPIGWMWNWWHYNAGIVPAWGFPFGEVLGLEMLGIPIEDWVFYPITGALFISIKIWDPFKCILFRNKLLSPLWLKLTLLFLLIDFCYFGILVLGKSGTITTICFGVPAIFMYLFIMKSMDVYKFIRLGIFVVLTNVLWDIWATPNQWYYNLELFSPHFWYLDIPFEMTPFLGIMSSYFIFGFIECLELLTLKRRNVWI